MRSLGIWIAIFVVALSTASGAQSPADSGSRRDTRLTPGARVRLRVHPDSQRIDGKIQSIEGDTLDVARDWSQPPVRLALGDLASLEVYGRPKEADEVVAVFGGLGFVTGSVLYFSWCARNEHECRKTEHREKRRAEQGDTTITRFGVTAVGTALLGGLLGYALTAPYWERVDLPVRVGVTPVREGVAVYVSLPLRRRGQVDRSRRLR